jgi:transposase InsO family protein
MAGLPAAPEPRRWRGWARLFTNKLPVTAVQTLNNEVLPTFEEHGAVIDAVLSDNGREFCGRADHWTALLSNPYELFLQLEGIAHKTTRVGRPQSTLPAAYARSAHGPRGSTERLHRTLLDEHLRVQGRTVWHETVAEMQAALDAFLLRYNRERPHQGRGMSGRTPWQAFRDGLPVRPEPEQEEPTQPIAA